MSGPEIESQETFDLAFDTMVRVDATLDAVCCNLQVLGIDVSGERRLVVSRWLDGVGGKEAFPMTMRIRVLRSWLKSIGDGSCRGL